MGYKFGQGYEIQVEINDKTYPVQVSPNKAPIFEAIQKTAMEIQDREDPEAVKEMEELVLEALDELLGAENLDDILANVPEEDKNIINYIGLAQFILQEINKAGGDEKTKKTKRANRRSR